MKETIIGLIGFFLGGVIGIAGQLISANLGNKVWKKEKSIECLRIKKEKLEEKYEKFIEEMYLFIEKRSFNANLFSEVMYIFPENVKDAFRKFKDENKKEEKDSKTLRIEAFNVISEMKKSLQKIDEEIKREIDK